MTPVWRTIRKPLRFASPGPSIFSVNALILGEAVERLCACLNEKAHGFQTHRYMKKSFCPVGKLESWRADFYIFPIGTCCRPWKNLSNIRGYGHNKDMKKGKKQGLPTHCSIPAGNFSTFTFFDSVFWMAAGVCLWPYSFGNILLTNTRRCGP